MRTSRCLTWRATRADQPQSLRCERDGEHKVIVVEHQGQEKRIEFDSLLCAVGRVAQGYGLGYWASHPAYRGRERIPSWKPCIPTLMRPATWLAPTIIHTAAHMAWYAAVNALLGDFKKFKVDYSVVPWATFIKPRWHG